MTVPRYVKWVEPSCNAGTAASAYTSTKVNLDQTFLWDMEVRIPFGHAARTGIALIDSAQFLIPFDPTNMTWIIGNDDLLKYGYGKQLGTNVALATYNTGQFVHGWEVRLTYSFMADVLAEPQPVITSTAPVTSAVPLALVGP